VTAADVIVIATLLAPALIENFAFLRVLRALRLLRSHHVLRDLRRRSSFVKRNEELLGSTLNLAVFIFVVTALVYVFQVEQNPQIGTYLDALYFTVTTLTTTGFGDITLEGPAGRVLSVAIMVFGVALFLRLVQTIFRPQKVHLRCPDCGLNRHDPDAVHCKHCGRVIDIETEGE
jgi:voltage-gated potassium channel